ncbi:F-box protein: endocytic membrane traffic, recycling ReCYcling 1 [Polyrhizophydium stewartii]|uniref:F-box protein: endocytic membrane traffic, recycling ReCYcling 1 n=1 Tax=Polyrhizophydium stewartii TaxID=2732419 RepID=A0ABR4N8N1_9FUNG
MLRRPPKEPPKEQPVRHISSLPPDLIAKIIGFLPVSELSKAARLSRRFKVLTYSDDVYEPKLRQLGVHVAAAAAVVPAEGGSAGTAAAGADSGDELVVRLRQLPGGQFLSTQASYLETGSLFVHSAGLAAPPAEASTPQQPPTAAQAAAQGTRGEPAAAGDAAGGGSDDGRTHPQDGDQGSPTSRPSATAAAAAAPQQEQQHISAALPDMRNSSLIIGAGGLKAALAKQALKQSSAPAIGRGAAATASSGGPHARGHSSSLVRSSGKPARLEFKEIFTQLAPLYFDFRHRQKDSKLFREHKDLPEIGALLFRLRLLDRARFSDDAEDISFSLETTIEWFESMVLGQFESAYDRSDVAEMRKTATALYNLNGGLACVNVFISKNPIFFDHTYNPSLVASKLPATVGPSVGYALADDFAKFMDHMLANCTKQAELISQIFVPNLNAMTLFVNKVFEDSISEYMSAILAAAKTRENFIDFISKNAQGVYVDADAARRAMIEIVRPYSDEYIELEMDLLNKRIKTELEKWDKRKSKDAKAVSPSSGQFFSAEQVQAHKRFVMNTMKAVIFAPVTLTKTLAQIGSGKPKPHRQALLNDAEPISADISPASDADHDGTVTYHLDDNSLNSLVSLELSLHLMHANKEALGRALVVTASTDMSKLRANVQRVFIALLKAVGERHIKVAFAKAMERMSKSGPVDESVNDKMVNMDSLQFFELVHVADLIQQMVDVYYNEDVKIWIDEQDFLSDIIVEKKNFERVLDDGVASGMDKAIQLQVNQCEYILLKQQKATDYNPPENGLFDWKPTEACESVITCLNAHTKLMSGVTEKNTMEVFLSEVGVRLFAVIIKNIRRLQVSQTGAMQLICDTNRYYEWATSVRVTSVSRLFSAISAAVFRAR